MRFGCAIGLIVIGCAIALRPVHGMSSRIVLISLGSVLTILVLEIGAARDIWPQHDTLMIGKLAADAENRGQVVGVKAPYYGEFSFAGRLKRPVIEIPYNQFPQWAEQNSNAVVILYTSYPPGDRFGRLIYSQKFQGRYASLMHARDVIGNETIARNCNDFYGDLSCSPEFI